MALQYRMLSSVLTALTFLLAGSASAQQKIGPSFKCTAEPVLTQPLAQILCSNSELSALELSYVIAFQALRHSLNESDRKSLTEEAGLFVDTTTSRCSIPKSGRLSVPPSGAVVACVKGSLEDARRKLLSRLSGDALQEAQLAPIEAKAIQQHLKEAGFLDQAAEIDGVFGPATRAAIVRWQRKDQWRETGYASKDFLKTVPPKQDAQLNSFPPKPSPAPQGVEGQQGNTPPQFIGPSYSCSSDAVRTSIFKQVVCRDGRLTYLELVMATTNKYWALYYQQHTDTAKLAGALISLDDYERSISSECRLEVMASIPATASDCIADKLTNIGASIGRRFEFLDNNLRNKRDFASKALADAIAQANYHSQTNNRHRLKIEQARISELEPEVNRINQERVYLSETWNELSKELIPFPQKWSEYQRKLSAYNAKQQAERERAKAAELAREQEEAEVRRRHLADTEARCQADPSCRAEKEKAAQEAAERSRREQEAEEKRRRDLGIVSVELACFSGNASLPLLACISGKLNGYIRLTDGGNSFEYPITRLGGVRVLTKELVMPWFVEARNNGSDYLTLRATITDWRGQRITKEASGYRSIFVAP